MPASPSVALAAPGRGALGRDDVDACLARAIAAGAKLMLAVVAPTSAAQPRC
jgi:hypothetical protein